MGVDRIAYGGGREGEHLRAAPVLGQAEGVCGEAGQRVDADLGHRALLIEVLGESQRLLVGVRRQRRGTSMRIDHEEVTGVGADVEHTQTHENNATGSSAASDPACAVRFGACLR